MSIDYENARARVSARLHSKASVRLAVRRRRLRMGVAALVSSGGLVAGSVAIFQDAGMAAGPTTVNLPSGTNLTIADSGPGGYVYVSVDGPVVLVFGGTDGVFGDNVNCVAGGGNTAVPRPVPDWNATCTGAGVVYGLVRSPLGLTCDGGVYVGMDLTIAADGAVVYTVPLVVSDLIGQPCGDAVTTTTTVPPTTTTTTEPPTTTTTLDPNPPAATTLTYTVRHVHSGKGGAYACVFSYVIHYPDGTTYSGSARTSRGRAALVRDPQSSMSWGLSCR